MDVKISVASDRRKELRPFTSRCTQLIKLTAKLPHSDRFHPELPSQSHRMASRRPATHQVSRDSSGDECVRPADQCPAEQQHGWGRADGVLGEPMAAPGHKWAGRGHPATTVATGRHRQLPHTPRVIHFSRLGLYLSGLGPGPQPTGQWQRGLATLSWVGLHIPTCMAHPGHPRFALLSQTMGWQRLCAFPMGHCFLGFSEPSPPHLSIPVHLFPCQVLAVTLQGPGHGQLQNTGC